MSLRALNDRVFIRPEPPPDITAGGIVLTDHGKDEILTIYSMVLCVGPKCTQVVAGDRVITNKWHGLEVVYRGERIVSIKEEELLGAVDEDGVELTVVLGRPDTLQKVV